MNIPLNIDWQQIFLHLLNFAILAMGLYLLLYKPVKDFMNKREAYYRQLDKSAKEKLSEAEEIEKKYDQQIKSIRDEIYKREADSAETLRQASVREMQQAKEQAEKIILDAKKDAKREHDRIIEDAQKEVADMVTAAAEKMLFQSSTSEVYDQFLAAAERSVQSE